MLEFIIIGIILWIVFDISGFFSAIEKAYAFFYPEEIIIPDGSEDAGDSPGNIEYS